jgi:hypothetical protein
MKPPQTRFEMALEKPAATSLQQSQHTGDRKAATDKKASAERKAGAEAPGQVREAPGQVRAGVM